MVKTIRTASSSRSPTTKAGRRTVRQSSCCTAGPPIRTTGTVSRHPWPRPAVMCWCHGCADTGRHDSSIPPRRAPVSRRPSALMCATSWTRWRSSRRHLRVTTGADVPHASSPPYGRSVCAGLFPSPDTTSRTSRRRAVPRRLMAEYRHWYQWYFQTERGRAGLTQNRRDIADCCGSYGRRTGASTMPLTWHGEKLRQSRLRRRDDPVLSPSLWRGAWRSGSRGDGTTSRCTTEDHGAHDRAAWCGRWRRAAGKFRAPRAAFYLAL